jgi:UPF0176 protein
MSIPKVILYYGFAPVADPEALKLWQAYLCESLALKGRILISKHGINGTLGGDMDSLKKYIRQTKQYPGFKAIDFKWSEALGDEFPRLSVKVRDELVTFGAVEELMINQNGIVGNGEHLTPSEVHSLVAERGDDVVFFDGRNSYEAKIGHFKNAVIPNVQKTSEFIAELESGKYDHLKTRPIVTYCTGGIRCEILSGLMKNRGFSEVYQIKGGIVRYGEEFKDDGFWQGSLYTFDGRMTIDFSDKTEVIGRCDICSSPTKQFRNCGDDFCHQLYLLCDKCAADANNLQCMHSKANNPDAEAVG